MTQYTKSGERNADKMVAKAMITTPDSPHQQEVCSVCGARAEIGIYSATGATAHYCAHGTYLLWQATGLFTMNADDE